MLILQKLLIIAFHCLVLIAEEEPEKARGYLELFNILANVWQALRHPPSDGQFDDED